MTPQHQGYGVGPGYQQQPYPSQQPQGPAGGGAPGGPTHQGGPPHHGSGSDTPPPPQGYGPSSNGGSVGAEGSPTPPAKPSLLSPPQLTQLRAQIMAYKLLARNQPVPDHINLAAQGTQAQQQGAPSQGPYMHRPPGESHLLKQASICARLSSPIVKGKQSLEKAKNPVVGLPSLSQNGPFAKIRAFLCAAAGHTSRRSSRGQNCRLG